MNRCCVEVSRSSSVRCGSGWHHGLTLTTNGSLLERKSEALAAAGLNRVTVSLDSMDDSVFMAMNDVGYPVESVLAGIERLPPPGSRRSRSTWWSSAA